MVSFLAAFCLMCFQHSSSSARVLVSSACAAIAILIGWCVWSSWESHSETPATGQLLPDDEDDEDPTGSHNDGGEMYGKEEDGGGEDYQSARSPATKILDSIGQWIGKLRKSTVDSEKTVSPNV